MEVGDFRVIDGHEDTLVCQRGGGRPLWACEPGDCEGGSVASAAKARTSAVCWLMWEWTAALTKERLGASMGSVMDERQGKGRS